MSSQAMQEATVMRFPGRPLHFPMPPVGFPSNSCVYDEDLRHLLDAIQALRAYVQASERRVADATTLCTPRIESESIAVNRCLADDQRRLNAAAIQMARKAAPLASAKAIVQDITKYNGQLVPALEGFAAIMRSRNLVGSGTTAFDYRCGYQSDQLWCASFVVATLDGHRLEWKWGATSAGEAVAQRPYVGVWATKPRTHDWLTDG